MCFSIQKWDNQLWIHKLFHLLLERLNIFSKYQDLLNNEGGKDRFYYFVDPLAKWVHSVDDQLVLPLGKELVTKLQKAFGDAQLEVRCAETSVVTNYAVLINIAFHLILGEYLKHVCVVVIVFTLVMYPLWNEPIWAKQNEWSSLIILA